MAEKRKKIKLKKTRGGAHQYGSQEDFRRQADKLFEEFLADPLADPDILEKKKRFEAGRYGASEFLDSDGRFEKLMMDFAKRDAQKRRNRPVRKAKGGAIRAYQNGGAVMKGRGPKFKGSR
jgi:hypothetical protein